MSRFPLLAAFILSVAIANAHDEVTPKPKLLQNGIPLRALAGSPEVSQLFQIVIPPDVDRLIFATRRGSGDCDIYVRHNEHPTDDRNDGRSSSSSSNEQIVIDAPAPGRWYLLLVGFTPFHDVRLTADYWLKSGAVALPRLFPAPGVFGKIARVHANSVTRGATVRYTTDNTPVTASSPVFGRRLTFVRDTQLRVRAFGKTGAMSEEVEGYYQILPPGAITRLVNGQPVFHRAGARHSEQLFQITLPRGQKFLRIRSEGGPGDTELFLRFGAVPTSQFFDQRSNGRHNRAAFEIIDPAPGNWFVLLRGRERFSGVSVLAAGRSNEPDLIVWRDSIDPYLDEAEFFEGDCEVEEGTIEPGRHTLLRFNTETRNIGGGDLIMPSPINHPDFEFAACHGHYHFKDFASYRLLDAQGLPVALGRKVSFCLLDTHRWDPQAEHRPRFNCEQQGIQAGWADIYDGGLPGQWIDITGLPDGTYTLEIIMNPEFILAEANYTNNLETIEVVIGTTESGVRWARTR